MVGRPAAAGRRDAQPHAALGGELEGVGQQVLEDLLQALGVGDDAARRGRWIDLRRRRTAACCSATWRNVRADGVEQAGEGDLLGVDRDRAGLDLRQVEDVVDQVQQVGAGAVDGAGELDLLGA